MTKKALKKAPEIVYGTPWIEVEFGQRDEGWKLFLDKEDAIKTTKADSFKGAVDGGYIGPVRPLQVFEIIFTCLEGGVQAEFLEGNSQAWSSNNWEPKFKDKGEYIR